MKQNKEQENYGKKQKKLERAIENKIYK